MFDTFKQVSDERYHIIISRYAQFQASMSDPSVELVSVFDPLNQKALDELELIREVSKDLQKKKEEDVNKAAEAEMERKQETKTVATPEEKEDA